MNPYQKLPATAFWKLSVAQKHMFDISELWDPKFNIKPQDKVATFGSCFAQHIGRALNKRGFNWLISEHAPAGCSEALAKRYNYGVFTARTGNIYTASLLKQWTKWALGLETPPEEVWQADGRFFDPFRPTIESNGFESLDDLLKTRQHTLACFRRAIEQSSYFVFTLGLTESWHNKTHGYEYPLCPGTAAGEFIEDEHVFINQKFDDIKTSLLEVTKLMKGVNSNLKFIFTVSPVPLAATNSKRHVAVATMASKSILRTVADELVTDYDDFDYFPSYEIINSPIFKGAFFEPNLRAVNHYGVDFVMDQFFACLENKFPMTASAATPAPAAPTPSQEAKKSAEAPSITKDADEVCDEIILESYAKSQQA